MSRLADKEIPKTAFKNTKTPYRLRRPPVSKLSRKQKILKYSLNFLSKRGLLDFFSQEFPAQYSGFFDQGLLYS